MRRLLNCATRQRSPWTVASTVLPTLDSCPVCPSLRYEPGRLAATQSSGKLSPWPLTSISPRCTGNTKADALGRAQVNPIHQVFLLPELVGPLICTTNLLLINAQLGRCRPGLFE